MAGIEASLKLGADVIVNTMDRRDISFTLMGAGDCHADLVAERDRLGLQDFVEMPGRVPDETVAEVLSTADVGLSPDPLNPLNDVSTMNKTMEYMSFGLPVVAFELAETRVSAQDAARYVEPNDVTAYALPPDGQLGNAKKGSLRGPGTWVVNFGIYKDVVTRGNFRLQFSARYNFSIEVGGKK